MSGETVAVREELFAHQRDAVEFALSKGSGSAFLYHDPGVGKTRTALEIFLRLKEMGRVQKALVVCPIELIEKVWRADAERFYPGEIKFQNLHDEPMPQRHADIVAVNYEFFTRPKKVSALMGFIRSIPHDKTETPRWLCVLDESSRMKNYRAATTKTLLMLRPLFLERIAMSGTPDPNDETEWWAQAEFVRPGIFGSSFHKFRNTYFHLERRGKIVELRGQVVTRSTMQELFRQGCEYRITPQKRAELTARLSEIVHRAEKDKCLDLPEQVDEVRGVRLGRAQAAAYRALRRELIAEIQGKAVVAQVALTKIVKLREIAAGFAVAEDGSTVALPENPKLAALSELLDELGARQAIVWCQFHWEVERVLDLLAVRGATAATLYAKTLDKGASVDDFVSGRARYLVAHPRSAAHGLTFVNCDQQVFLSLDYSWEAYEQARARTHRAGQKRTCVYHHILAEGTVDEEILAVLRRKGAAADAVDAMLRREP